MRTELIAQIAPVDLASWRADSARPAPVIVDVREPWEFDLGHIEGSMPLPLAQLAARRAELPGDRDLVLVCHHGSRSQQAAAWLAQNGFPKVSNLRGGVEAWSLEVDAALPRY